MWMFRWYEQKNINDNPDDHVRPTTSNDRLLDMMWLKKT